MTPSIRFIQTDRQLNRIALMHAKMTAQDASDEKVRFFRYLRVLRWQHERRTTVH